MFLQTCNDLLLAVIGVFLRKVKRTQQELKNKDFLLVSILVECH